MERQKEKSIDSRYREWQTDSLALSSNQSVKLSLPAGRCRRELAMLGLPPFVTIKWSLVLEKRGMETALVVGRGFHFK